MTTDEELERLVADIPKPLKERMKNDPRSIREITTSSLKREYQTGDMAALDRRIEEKQSRIDQLQRERNEREREIAEAEDELKRLETTLQRAKENQSDGLAEAVNAVSKISNDKLTEDNPAVQNWAEKVGITPRELITEVQNRK
jgi:septal ring factor EnvC (AmiA/AmiB activator)